MLPNSIVQSSDHWFDHIKFIPSQKMASGIGQKWKMILARIFPCMPFINYQRKSWWKQIWLKTNMETNNSSAARDGCLSNGICILNNTGHVYRQKRAIDVATVRYAHKLWQDFFLMYVEIRLENTMRGTAPNMKILLVLLSTCFATDNKWYSNHVKTTE